MIYGQPLQQASKADRLRARHIHRKRERDWERERDCKTVNQGLHFEVDASVLAWLIGSSLGHAEQVSVMRIMSHMEFLHSC